MRCPYCGELIHDNSNFCPYCSKKLVQTRESKPIIPMIIIAASTIVIITCVLFFLGTNIVSDSIIQDPNTDPGITPIAIDTSSSDDTQTNVSPDTPADAASTSAIITQTAETSTASPEETASTPAPTETPTPVPTETPMPTDTPIPATNYITVYGGYQAPTSDFIFPESSDEYLSYARMNEMLEAPDKETMNRRSQLAINELLARYGYPFTNKERQTAQDARDQFNNKDWYQQVRTICPSTDYKTILNVYMNDYERSNFNALNDWQKDHDVWY